MKTPNAQPRFHILRSYEECQQLRESWDNLLNSQSESIDQLDLTAGFDWAMALWQSHLKESDQSVLVLRDAAGISGILPLQRFQKTVRGVSCRSVAPITELYAGRTGFLLREPQLSTLQELFACLAKLDTRWDAFVLTVVKDSEYERLLLDQTEHQGWHVLRLGEERSPFIPFQDTWEQHFASLPKKLRSTMRNGEKRLREKGDLTYLECRSPEEVAQFNAAVDSIERDSWKAEAGTSIASNSVHHAFHQNLALRAAAAGRFSGHLLLLNGEPIAYIMGLLHNGVFLDLKESYRVSFREMSPGHVLKYFAFARLYEQGTRLYDFMGKCEEYKLKWTDRTYSRVTYGVISNTLRGRAVQLANFVSNLRSRGNVPPRVAPSPAGAEKAVQPVETI